LILRVLLSLGLTCLATVGQAQPLENGTSFRDWTLACRAAAVGQTDCVLSQVLVTSENQELVAEVTLAPAQSGDEKGAVVIVMRVPTGVVLRLRPEFVVLGQSGGADLEWLTCDERYCTAARTLDADLVADLRRGVNARLGYRRMEEETPAIFDFSLLGVTAGLKALQEAAEVE